MQTLHFYNQELFFKGRLQKFIKQIMGRDNRGPQVVFLSLTQGLEELKVPYYVNRPLKQPVDIACVLSGVNVLKWAVRQKQKGKIKKIIAGPNLVVSPTEHNSILCDGNIDVVVVPSQWVKDFYVALVPALAPKIHIWAAGVDLPAQTSASKDIDFVILNKMRGDMSLYDKIERYLEEQKFNVSILFYGSFEQKQYFANLDHCKYLIYLSESESQGLALFEAWARNVPALVWDRGYFDNGGKVIEGKIGAPYISEQTGATFKDFKEFEQVLKKFMGQTFVPREWVINNATNRIAAQKYLDIVNA